MDTTIHTPTHTSFRTSVIAKPQKAFAVAFAVLATALAGCASGLGAKADDSADATRVARVEEGTIVGALAANTTGSHPGFAYTIRLPTGELVSVAQAGEFVMPAGTPVLIEYGASARVVPQHAPYGI